MRLVCEECARMEAVLQQQLPHVFQRLPLNTHGNLPLSQVCCLPFSARANDVLRQQSMVQNHFAKLTGILQAAQQRRRHIAEDTGACIMLCALQCST